MESFTSGDLVHKKGATSSSSSEHERDRDPALLGDAARDYHLSITGRERSMSPVLLHRDKAEEPSIESVLDASTPVNSASRTNSIASSSTTLVSYESPSTTALITSLSRLFGWQEEPHSCITSILESKAPFDIPFRSVGQRVETWPRVSGNPTRAMNYQESIRLVRSTLSSPDKSQESMTRRNLVSSNESYRYGSDEVPDAIKVHPPLAIRQQTSPTHNQTASNQPVSRQPENQRSCSNLSSLISAHKFDASNIPARNPLLASQGHRDITNLHPTYPSEEEVTAICRHPIQESKAPNVSNQLEHERSLRSHSKSRADAAKSLEDAPVRTSQPTGGQLRSAHLSLSPAAFNVASSNESHTMVEEEVPISSPRLGIALPRTARRKSYGGHKVANPEHSDPNVDVASSLVSVATEKHDSSFGLSHNTKTTIPGLEELGGGVEERSVKRDHVTAKRSSCHELDLGRPEKYRKKASVTRSTSPVQVQDDDYHKLVEDIRYIVSMSPCITQLEERRVPLDSFIHGFLEQVCNYENFPHPGLREDLGGITTTPAQDGCAGAKPPGDDRYRVKKPGRGRKRGNARDRGQRSNQQSEDPDDSVFEDNEGGSEDDSQATGKSGKSGSVTESRQQYGCPYRKRNPTRFNIRNREQCALRGFADLALLKRHIQQCHRINGTSHHRCLRCKVSFESESQLSEHMTQALACEVQNNTAVTDDPEDGITETIQERLRDRGHSNRVNTWEAIWGLLFPEDTEDDIPRPYYEPPIELDDVQKELYNEKRLSEFLHSNPTENHFAYIIDILEECRTKFGHQSCMRRDEQNNIFRAATERLLRRTQGPLQAHQRGSWTSAPMVAPQPVRCLRTDAFSNTQASTSFLTPGTAHRTFVNTVRARDCSSRTSMRSGASSASHFDNDMFPTPGTSQDGHLDIPNATSSTNSSIYLQPQVELGKQNSYPPFEPPETILPDQRRPSAPHNITTPVEPSYSGFPFNPFVEQSLAWNGSFRHPQWTSNVAESSICNELADHDAGSWPASYYTFDEPADTEHQPGFPESWDYSQDPSSLCYEEKPGANHI